MKRILMAATIAALLIPMTNAEAKPHLGRWRGPCATFAEGENLTPAMYEANRAKGERQITHLITCVFRRFAPGNEATAVAVARRESGLWPWSINSSSGCAGLFQHITWTDRISMVPRWMFAPGYHPTAFDPRANALVAAFMVAGVGDWPGGWGPWGG